MDQADRIFTGKDEQIGKVFGVKIGGKWGRGIFQGTRKLGGLRIGRRAVVRYDFINQKTGRDVVIKSRVKIAGMLDPIAKVVDSTKVV